MVTEVDAGEVVAKPQGECTPSGMVARSGSDPHRIGALAGGSGLEFMRFFALILLALVVLRCAGDPHPAAGRPVIISNKDFS